MRKKFYAMTSFAALVLFAVGCTSLTTKKHSDADAAFEKFKNERPVLEYVNTGDESLDNAAVACTKIYGATIKYLDEYITAKNEQRPYLGFQNEVQAKLEADKKLTMEEACNIVLAEAKKNDEGKSPDQQEYPRIIAGMKASKALKPQNKITELCQLTKEVDELIDNTNGLSQSFKGFDLETVKKINSAKNILKQAKFSGEALDFLQYRYQQENNFEKYMQK